MRIRLVTIIVIATGLGCAACGGADDTGDARTEVADLFVDLAADNGIELDRDCVVGAAGGLSDADAEALLDAGSAEDAGLSDNAEAVGREMLDCVEIDSYLDGFLEQFESDGSIDVECLRDALEGLATVSEIGEQAADAARGCAR